jgi:hypothetical protein
MKRCIVVVAVVAVAAMFVALPAQAKPEHGDPMSGQAVITGPGLKEPIVIEGQADFQGVSTSSGFGSLLRYAGMLGSEEATGHNGLAPDPAALGPRYVIRYVFESRSQTGSVTQHLYPFASGGPVFFNPPGQSGMFFPKSGRPGPSAWWMAPRALVYLLRTHGLPSSPLPPVSRPTAALPAAGLDATRTWVAIAVVGALMTLLLVGAWSGRRRSVGAA